MTTSATGVWPEADSAPNSEPLRHVRVQLAGEGNQHVDMRLIERGGTLSVSVRSTDETLTRNLQQNLPQLNARLATQHFQTEAWTPVREIPMDFGGNDGAGHHFESQAGTGSSGSGGGKQGGSSSEEQSGDRNRSGHSQDGRQDDRPAWVRHLTAWDEVSRIFSGAGPVIADSALP